MAVPADTRSVAGRTGSRRLTVHARCPAGAFANGAVARTLASVADMRCFLSRRGISFAAIIIVARTIATWTGVIDVYSQADSIISHEIIFSRSVSREI